MDRLAAKTGAALLALTLLAGALPAGAAPPAPSDVRRKRAEAAAAIRRAEGAGKRPGSVQLEAVNIAGTPEHPAILFFLPRARFRLLPLRTDRDWKERLLTETKETSDVPR